MCADVVGRDGREGRDEVLALAVCETGPVTLPP